jgi:hypothetical protein
MEVISASIVAFLLPVLGVIFNTCLSRFMRGKKKDIVIQKSSGQKEVLSVNALASDDQVLKTVRLLIDLEDKVFKMIKDLERRDSRLHVRRGKFVDFIAEYKNLRLAIECKSSLDHSSQDSIQQYLADEENPGKLLVLTQQPVRPSAQDFLRRLPGSERVKVVDVGRESGSIDAVQSLILKELHMTVPT